MLYTETGLRAYRVFLVWARWTGGQRGEGRLIISKRVEVLPRPKVSELTAIEQALRPVGVSEEGGLRVTQISMAWTEDLLTGICDGYMDESTPLRRSLAPDVEFWWEVVEQRPAVGGQPAPREGAPKPRRFRPQAAPNISRDGFQWEIRLSKQDYDVDRDGDITI
jgi:hypothetical protein